MHRGCNCMARKQDTKKVSVPLASPIVNPSRVYEVIIWTLVLGASLIALIG